MGFLMRKSVILLIIVLGCFGNPMSMTYAISDNELSINCEENSINIDDPSLFQPDKMSYDNGTWAQFTSTPFAPDGAITDWKTEGIIPEKFGGVTVYLAYDATYVYVATIWYDDIVQDGVCFWNKTDTHDGYEILPEHDDIISIGFSNSTYSDFWTWSASNRTAYEYAYEHDGDGTADSGTLPHIKNTNGTDFLPPNKPLYDNVGLPIIDHSTVPINSHVKGWLEETPTGSQTDVIVGMNHNGSYYIVEFVRELDTGNFDDIVIDLTNNDVNFYIGVANGDDSMDMDIAVSEHLIFDDNTAAELTFDAIPGRVTSSLLLQGTAFDDYEDYYVTVWVETWADTWGSADFVSVNRITGAWSYLLIFNEMDMPLGYTNITITLYAPYEEVISITQPTEIDDIQAPQIIGMTDIGERYPNGVPEDELYVTVAVGLQDDYDDVNYLVTNIYWYKDQGIALAAPMIQFAPDSSTFIANITLDPTDDYRIEHNYSYFIQAWDTSNNKVRSATYTFTTYVTDPGFTPTTIISGIPFSSIISSLILSGCLIAIIRFRKRRIY